MGVVKTYTLDEDGSLDGGRWWCRNICTTAAQVAVNGSAVRFQLQGHSTNNETLFGMSFGERSGTTEDFASTPTRITFNGGASGVTIPANSTLWSDWVPYGYIATTAHLIHLSYEPDGTTTCWFRMGWLYDGRTRAQDATDLTMTLDVTGAASGYWTNVSAMEIYSDTLEAVRHWDGGAWVRARTKVYLGGAWQYRPIRRWSGAAWINIDGFGD